ncbi:MAG: HdeD family acid-resistance protein [Bacteroidales bacterium]
MKINRLGQWGLSSLNGILVLIFGCIAIFFPSLTIKALAIYFAIAVLIGGAVLIANAIRIKEYSQSWKLMMLEGVIGILLGIVILSRSELAAKFLMVVIGLWALFIGAVFFYSFYKSTLPSSLKSFHLITGIISAILGVIIILNPFESSQFAVVLIGIYAIAYGIFSIVSNSKSRIE